jgi:CheY-like chemotaxis protein
MERYIVYVEDDPDDRMLFKEAFDLIPDYDLLTLVNGFELLLFLKQRNEDLPCLIVLDINMPVMNGLEALSILKANNAYRNIPVVMFSTAAKPEDIEYCKNLDTDILLKPRKFGDIRNTVKEFLKYCGQ